jgi:pilus assembly protein CpaE
MSAALPLLVASGDEQFREMVRDNLMNIPDGKIAAEYQEVSQNLYVRVLQDIERYPHALTIIDLAGDPEQGLKALERLKQAAPDLYVIASHYHADGETVIQALRAGANDFILQPLKRTEFRESIARYERAPKRHLASESKLGKVYTFLGVKGGVGTTTLALNFASVLAQRKNSVVAVDLDWAANDLAMQTGAAPQYTLAEVAANLSRMDQALFESFVARDPLGFYLIGPADSPEKRGYFTDAMFREFGAFLIDKYDAVVVDAGRNLSDEVVMGACQVSITIFLVMTQEFASIRNAQRYLTALGGAGFTQDQIRIVVNRYQKKAGPNVGTLEQIRQTLNQPVFYGVPDSPAFLTSINKSRPLVSDRDAAPEVDKAIRTFVDKATKPASVAGAKGTAAGSL